MLHRDANEGVSMQHAEPFNEQVIYQNPQLFLRIWEIASVKQECEPLEKWGWHFHKEVEFLSVMEGNLGIQHADGYQVLGPGDVFVVGGNMPHRTHKTDAGALRYIVFQVDLVQYIGQGMLPYFSFFSETIRPLHNLNHLFKQNDALRREISQLIETVLDELTYQTVGYEISVSASIHQIMLRMLRHDLSYENRFLESKFVRLLPVLNYVEAHLHERITIQTACSILNLSYYYFIKYFRETIGLSFVDYVNQRRIERAERLLLTQERNVSSVADQVGIPNMAQFYKLFRRYNRCTPAEFRKQMS